MSPTPPPPPPRTSATKTFCCRFPDPHVFNTRPPHMPPPQGPCAGGRSPGGGNPGFQVWTSPFFLLHRRPPSHFPPTLPPSCSSLQVPELMFHRSPRLFHFREPPGPPRRPARLRSCRRLSNPSPGTFLTPSCWPALHFRKPFSHCPPSWFFPFVPRTPLAPPFFWRLRKLFFFCFCLPVFGVAILTPIPQELSTGGPEPVPFWPPLGLPLAVPPPAVPGLAGRWSAVPFLLGVAMAPPSELLQLLLYIVFAFSVPLFSTRKYIPMRSSPPLVSLQYRLSLDQGGHPAAAARPFFHVLH